MAKNNKKKKPQDWRARFVEQFPEYAKVVDGAEGEAQARAELGDDFVDLLLDYANNPDQYDLDSQAGQAAWVRKVRATNLYTKVDPARREWAILPQASKDAQLADKIDELRKVFGEMQFDDTELLKVATYSLSNKASELQTRYYAYSIVGERQATAGGAPALAQTDMAAALKEALQAYGYSPPNLDKRIESALTGKEYAGVKYTEEGLMKQARDYSKVLYPHLSQQLDQGYSMDDIFAPYQQIAANTLGLDVKQVNINDPKYSKALQRNATGMSMSPDEWRYMLRKDPVYGWQNTTEAKNAAASMISMLEKNFGIYV